jgi:hypothetical protein
VVANEPQPLDGRSLAGLVDGVIGPEGDPGQEVLDVDRHAGTGAWVVRDDYRVKVLFGASICRLTDVVAVVIWGDDEPVAGERAAALPLAPSPDDPVVAFFGRQGRAPTRLFSCYYLSTVLGRPADAPLAIDLPEGPPAALSAADWRRLRAWLRQEFPRP